MSGKSSKWSLQGHTAVCLGPSIEQETGALALMSYHFPNIYH